jgi:hypothetical protein
VRIDAPQIGPDQPAGDLPRIVGRHVERLENAGHHLLRHVVRHYYVVSHKCLLFRRAAFWRRMSCA